MGKYKEKDYVKNTEIFKGKITDAMYEINDSVTQRALNVVLMALKGKIGVQNCTKGPSKEDLKKLEEIDDRIATLIDKLWEDVQTGKKGKMRAHAQAIETTVSISRKFGRQMESPEAIRAQDTMAEALANITDSLDAIAVASVAMQEQIDKAAQFTGPDAEAKKMRCKLEYSRQKSIKAAMEKNVDMFTSRFNAALKVINAEMLSDSVEELKKEDLISPVAFAKKMDKLSDDIAEQAGIDTGIEEVAKEFEEKHATIYSSRESADDEFDQFVSQKQASDLQSSIDGASVPQAELDEFDELTKKKTGGNW